MLLLNVELCVRLWPGPNEEDAGTAVVNAADADADAFED